MLAPTVATVNAHNFVSKTMNAKSVTPATDLALFQDGFAAYCEGQALADMPTAAQERGWWHANRSQAYAETSAYLVGQSKARRTLSDAECEAEAADYEDYLADIDFNRHGC